MPKIKCKCNNIIHLGQIPSPAIIRLYKDTDMEKLVEKIRAGTELDAFMATYDYSIEAVQCDVCGRLWIDKHNDRNYLEYIKGDPEEEML